MTIRLLRPGDEDRLERFLSGHAETTMFLRSNLRASGLEYADAAFHGDYLASFSRDGQITGVLAHYWNGNVMMQAGGETVLRALIASFRDRVERPVAGVLGPAGQAAAVIAGLGLSDARFATNADDGLFALDLENLIVPPRADPDPFRMVAARAVGRPVLAGWLRAYEIEALGSDDGAALDAHVARRIDLIVAMADCWALLDEGRPVCLAGFNARLPDMVQLGPVWTPPELRGRGYARALVARTLCVARDQGVATAILFTDSPAATRAYEAIGFRRIGSFRLAILKEPVPVGKTRDARPSTVD